MLEKNVYQLLSQDASGHSIDHIQRVLDLSITFAKKKKADLDIVRYIALLHDVDDYKLFGEENAKNLTNAKQLMQKENIPMDKQTLVLKGIQEIGYSKRLKGVDPSFLEAQIVSDADMCDALGAHGILRTFQFSLNHDRPFFDASSFPREDLTAERYTQKKDDTGINHFFEKILKLKDLMLTPSGQEEALKRHQIVVDFLYHYFQEENAQEWIDYLNNYLK